MNRARELKKLARQTFPISKYSLKEIRNHRKNLYSDMLSYVESHPESTIDDVKALFCDSIETNSLSDVPRLKRRIVITMLVVLLLILACIALIILLRNIWQPPEYIYNSPNPTHRSNMWPK